MVAKIKTGKSLNGALNYNEHKVAKGAAVLISAQGFQKDAAELSHYDKLARLTDLAERNQRVTTNTLHASLNFDVSEKLDDGRLCAIVHDYMVGIGFANQPYLVYRHTDAGHQHVHIVSTNIDSHGNRISFHNLGKFQSESARRSIEEKYDLVKAESKKVKAAERIKPEPIVYGTTDSKRAVSNLVNEVSRTYKFTSLAEFNALLSAFHVVADRGNKASVMFQKNGLRYWITDPKGRKLGVPFKASSIYGKPTLPALEKSFRLNAALRKPFREGLKDQLDQAIRKSINLADLHKNLRKVGIDVIQRVNPDGKLYGLTFIDHRQKVVFNGSDIGKPYSAAGIMSALQYNRPGETGLGRQDTVKNELYETKTSVPISGATFLDKLFETEHEGGIPGELRRTKRKKRRKKNL
jgi:hypothetical protein